MRTSSLRWGFVIALAGLVLIIVGLAPGHPTVARAATLALPTPGPGAMSIYTVSNSSSAVLNVEHVFTDNSGFTYSFWDQIGPGATTTYHVSNMAQIPEPFNGTLNLYGNQPFSSQIVGYDYPGSPTPALPTPTATVTPIPSSPTVTATRIPSASPTSTATPRAVLTATPTAGTATIRYVQSVLGYTGNMVSSQSVTFPGAVASGDLVIVAISSWNGSNNATVSSITDNFGNTYTKALDEPSPATGSSQPLSIWYAANVVGGSNFTVTANLANAGALSVAAHEYSGAATSNVVDQLAQQSGADTTATSGATAATTQANDLLFGATTYTDGANLTATAGSGFTLRQNETDNSCCTVLYTEDGLGAGTSPYAATFGFPQLVNYHAAIVAFRAASATSNATPTATTEPTSTATPTSTSSPLPTRTPTQAATNTPISGGALPRYVQSALSSTGSNVASRAVTFSSAVTSGDLVVVAVASYNGNNTATVGAVTDNFGNVYTKATGDPSPETDGPQPLSIWYAANVVGGSNFTVTVKLQSAGSLTVAIHEYAGAATSSVVDQTAHANGRGTVASSGPAATTSANDLLFAATTHWDSTNTSATAGAGFTLRRSLANNTTAAALFTEDQPVTTTGTYAGTFKYAHTANYRAAVIAFRSR